MASQLESTQDPPLERLAVSPLPLWAGTSVRGGLAWVSICYYNHRCAPCLPRRQDETQCQTFSARELADWFGEHQAWGHCPEGGGGSQEASPLCLENLPGLSGSWFTPQAPGEESRSRPGVSPKPLLEAAGLSQIPCECAPPSVHCE